jgi:hypothetical protein
VPLCPFNLAARCAARYPTRSEAEAALVASLIRAGYEFDEIAHLFNIYPGPGKYVEKRTKNPRDAIRYLRLTYGNALEFVTTHASEMEQKALWLKAWAPSRPWPGRSGSTDRAVFLAHCEVAEKCGADPHGASARQLAELAGVNWRTAAKANRRLVKASLLTVAVPSVASLSARYNLLEPDECTLKVTLNHLYCDVVSLKGAHDTFRWHGLGKTGADVLAMLRRMGDDGARVCEIAAATGRHRNTVSRKLRRMVELGLAEPMGNHYYRAVESADLDAAAVELGTAGKGAAERKRHQDDRRELETMRD